MLEARPASARARQVAERGKIDSNPLIHEEPDRGGEAIRRELETLPGGQKRPPTPAEVHWRR